MGRRSTRGWLYWIAKILGDFTAINKGRSIQRAKRRITGRWLSRLMRVILLGSLLIPIYKNHELIPSYYIRESPDGSIRIYEPGQILIPKFVIRDGKLYEPGKPLTPLLNVEPFSNDKGGQIWKKK